MARHQTVLHRDDPDKDPLVGHIKVTREDWLNAARDVLVNDGVEQVKVQPLGVALGVSRSSFYGYFRDRSDLLDQLLDGWEARNSAPIIDMCALPATNITEAACNFFRCFVDPELFDPGVDFAVREWARRDTAVRRRIDAADAARLKAVIAMFERHGYGPTEADARARILYYMQLGYHALEVREDIETRMERLGPYLEGFTGRPAEQATIQNFVEFARSKVPG